MQGQPLQQVSFALHSRGETRVADPFHCFLVVGGDRGMGDYGVSIRPHHGRQIVPFCIQNRHIIAHVGRYPRQSGPRFLRGFAGLQHIAQDQRYAKPVTDNTPPPKGKRNGKAGVVLPAFAYHPLELHACGTIGF